MQIPPLKCIHVQYKKKKCAESDVKLLVITLCIIAILFLCDHSGCGQLTRNLICCI